MEKHYTKYRSLGTVKKEVSACTRCILHHDRTNAVPGKGDHKSKVIFVGEAPGKSEDLQGEPFVGSAGKRLTTALEQAGITRESVYITNIIKCRPPDNRVPSDSERQECMPYLDAEILLLKPKIICIMGNTAFKSLLGGTNITKYRGTIQKKNGLQYFITIHPAATIYNRQLFPTLVQDMKKLAGLIK